MLTPDEKKILDTLAEAWNLFVNLPAEHPSDASEFNYTIHILQRQIMARPTRRFLKEKELTESIG